MAGMVPDIDNTSSGFLEASLMVLGNLTREELEDVADEAVTLLSQIYQIYAVAKSEWELVADMENIANEKLFPFLLKYSAEYQDNG